VSIQIIKIPSSHQTSWNLLPTPVEGFQTALDPGCDQAPVLFPFVLSPYEVFFVFTRAVHPTIIDASKSVDPETGARDTLDRKIVTGDWLTYYIYV